MPSLEEFENALKDVVSSKRVSLSKMNKLSEVAKKCFENDAQLVSMLYRTHKSLQPQFKVPSLYAFDALARAARSHATKHGFAGDAQSGNSATFLLKLEAVLEGLFQDMMGSGVPEGKEKAKKILDIWTKSTTFPPAVLTRLENVLKGDDATVPAPVSDAVIEPVRRSAPPQAALNLPVSAETPTDPANQASSVQAALLALLSQVPVSAADGLQTTANNSQSAQVQLDANQLKLFQQLTQTVHSSEITPPPIQTPLVPPPLAPISASSEILAGPSHQPTYWNNSRGVPDKPWDAGQAGRNYQTSSIEENDYHSPRGRFRGGYRSRGRGRFGDRDLEGYRDRDRFYDRPCSPGSVNVRRSRSRSPPRSRYGAGRRDVKPYSPPHRPSIADQPDVDVEAPSSHPEVDEFGREIRLASDDDGSMTPDDLKQQRPAQSPPPPPAALSASAVETSPASGERVSPATAPPQATASAASSSGVDDEAHGDASQSGLHSFDYSTFDPTSPSSWEALGQAWAVTNGRPPSQEELMMFVMEFTVSMASQASPTPSGPPMQGNQRGGYGWMGEPRGGPPRGGGRGRGAFGTRGGRGGFAYSNAGDGQAQWDYGGDGYAGGTDAIVLGEHANTQNGFGWAQGSHELTQGEEGGGQEGSQSASGGRMQNVGDTRVFS
ncbi:hypothetical protein BJV78DRAFT_1174366 [Lactifluus subvellereus]|nr:hypothetical protein BJV78DRAFT_1174366 [Lactifluus subvellereus]